MHIGAKMVHKRTMGNPHSQNTTWLRFGRILHSPYSILCKWWQGLHQNGKNY